MGDYTIILNLMVIGEFYTRQQLFDLVKDKIKHTKDFGMHINTLRKNKAIFFSDGVYGRERMRMS